MKLITLVVAFGLWFNPLFAGPDLADYFSEDVFLYIGIEDAPRMTERFEASPLHRFVESGEFKKLMKSMAGDDEELEFTEQEQAEIDLIKLHVRGDAAFVISDMTKMFEVMKESFGGGDFVLPDDVLDPDAEPGDLFGAGEDESEELEKMLGENMIFAMVVGDQKDAFLTKMKELGEAPDEDDPDATFKVLERTVDGFALSITEMTKDEETEEVNFWTVIDDIAILGDSEVSVLHSARHIKAGGHANPLSGSIGFARAMARDDEADGILYINPKSLAEFANREIEAAEMPQDSGLDGERVAAILELGEIDPLYFTFRLAEEGIRFKAGYGFANETRLSKVLMPYVDKVPDRPDFVPVSAVSAGSVRLDMSDFHDSVVDLMNNLNPQFGAMIPLVTLQVKGMLGIDYKKDLIDNMADSMVYAQFMDVEAAEDNPDDPMAGSGYLVAMRMKNRPAMEGTIRTAMASMGVPEDDVLKKESLLGHTLNMIVPAQQEGMEVGYAMLGEYLVLGIGTDVLKSAVRTLADPKTSMWNSEAFQRLESQLDSDAVSIEYSNFTSLFTQMSMLSGAGLAPEGDALPDLKPLSKLFGNALRTNFKDGSRMQMDGILLYGDDE